MNFSRIINFYIAMKRLKVMESEELLTKISEGINNEKIVEFIEKISFKKKKKIFQIIQKKVLIKSQKKIIVFY
jgi:hypothetical protein